jgi:hypothetical protein
VRHQSIGLFETGYPEASLEQRDGEHFGIGKSGLIVRELPPVR